MERSEYCGITGDELAEMLREPSKYSKKEAEEIIKKAEESAENLKIIFRKEVDVPQLLKSSCAKGYNAYIRVAYNWNKEADEKHFLTDEEFDRIKRSSEVLK